MTETPKSEIMTRLPNLNGLRFFMAFLVVIYHIRQFCQNRSFPFVNDVAVFEKGEEAVYMFFSLSGFLIIRQLYIEKSESNTIQLFAFFKRRILRIFPLYYLILTFGFLYYRFILPYLGFDYENNYNLMYGIFLSYTFFPNIFATFNPGGIIEVLRSIGVEEQFYLFIAPLILIIPFKYISRFLLMFTITYFLIYFSHSTQFMRDYGMCFFYFSFSGFCSIIAMNIKFKLNKLKYVLFALFILYFTTAIFSDNLNPFCYHLFSMILFGFALCGFTEKPLKMLDNKWIHNLGKISYGIYMYHAIMIQLVGLIFLKSNIHLKIANVYSILIFNLIVPTLTIIVAHLSYKYFESYFLNGGFK